MPTQATLQSDFVIGVLTGVLALASLSLAIFGFVFSTFAQIMAQVGAEKPPSVAYRLKEVAWFTLVLTGVSTLISVLCILWIYVQSQNLLYFISISVALVLILICFLIFYVIKEMMKLQ